MYRRQNQSQHLQSQQTKTFVKRESENPAYDRQSVYDDINDLDQETYGPYDVADDGACYDELTDFDNGVNETYDHPEAVPGPSMPTPYDGLNVGIYDRPDAGPALPDRPTHNPSQYINTTPAYLELDEQNQTTVHQEPNTAPDYLELIHVDDDKNQTAEC